MTLQREVHDKFLNLFNHVIDGEDLGGSNRLNVFSLKISNNRFTYRELVDELAESVVSFSLSRSEQKRLDSPQGAKRYREAVARLRNFAANEGEFGEILLYCFLESHLKAPKVLSKLELKSAANDYVKGSDGVHLLKVSDSTYQLVLGESKLDAKIADGIKHAFDSITKFLTENNRDWFESMLIRSNIIKEALDQNSYDALAKIIIPTERPADLNLDKSFGIFLGFDFDIPEDKKNLGNDAFRTYAQEEIKAQVVTCLKKVKEKISQSHLHGYTFYVYIVPFTDLAEQRKEMIKQLTNP